MKEGNLDIKGNERVHEVRVERARISSILQAAQRNGQLVQLPIGIS